MRMHFLSCWFLLHACQLTDFGSTRVILACKLPADSSLLYALIVLADVIGLHFCARGVSLYANQRKGGMVSGQEKDCCASMGIAMNTQQHHAPNRIVYTLVPDVTSLISHLLLCTAQRPSAAAVPQRRKRGVDRDRVQKI
jgi:hypothetical protein